MAVNSFSFTPIGREVGGSGSRSGATSLDRGLMVGRTSTATTTEESSMQLVEVEFRKRDNSCHPSLPASEENQISVTYPAGCHLLTFPLADTLFGVYNFYPTLYMCSRLVGHDMARGSISLNAISSTSSRR